MRAVLLTSVSIHSRQLFIRPATSCARKRVATMTYSAFDFEVFGKGEPKSVSQMKDWLQHKGPSGARIDKCSITNERSDLDKLTYSSFEKH
ncbi:MAG: hypothetical protein FRX49_04068 [Trebouxia sp. A1-2]|nr:MAG: hypothetical protein FRX49_04068 [Trebouxia sp. A1-2]